MSFLDCVSVTYSSPIPGPIAFVTKSEPGWRVVKLKYDVVPGRTFYIEGKYKLTVLPVRFWGHRVTPSMAYRGKVDNSYESITRELGNRKSTSIVSSNQSMPPLPVPLGKGKKHFTGVIDLLDPHEADKSALERIEAHFEHERQVLIFSRIQEVMES